MKRIIIIIISVLYYCSCSNVSVDSLSGTELPLISISKETILSKDGLDAHEQEQFAEARSRFLSFVGTTDEGERYINKSAEDLCICSDLYDLFHIAFITLPNARMHSHITIITKSYNPDDSVCTDVAPDDTMATDSATGTRGNNRLVDRIARSIESMTSELGWTTTAHYWHMWYFDVREDSYILSENEWSEVKSYAETVYRSHRDWTSGDHSIQFTFNEDPDLHFSYGSAVATFDSNGNCIGFRDTYDMNRMSGQRSELDELITEFLSYLGNTEGGFEIRYSCTAD